MADHEEIIPAGQKLRHTENPITRRFKQFTSQLAKRREEQRVLSENELALERMSGVAYKIFDLLNDPEFQKMERAVDDSNDQDGIRRTAASLQNTETGLSYNLTIKRYQDGRPLMIEAYVSPTNKDNYTSGRNDGYFRIYFGEGFSDKTTEKHTGRKLITWGNTDISGDVYLGKESAEFIDSVSVDNITTRVKLKGVDFGGHPSIHLTLNAGSRSKEGNYIGPIGKINELWVHGLARAKNPIEGHIMDSEMVTIPISGDFDHVEKPFVFNRGGANFVAAKRFDPQIGGEVLGIRFSGIRQRWSGVKDQPIIDGPENKDIVLPMDTVNGFKVIDLFENAIDGAIVASRQKIPQLTVSN